ARRDVEVRRTALRRVPGEALHAVRVQVAVGDQGAVEGDADLAAMGVAGQDQGVAVGREGVQDAPVRGVYDAQREARRTGRAARHLRIAVALDVRVVQARQLHRDALDLQGAPGVRQVQPARPVETVPQVFPGDVDRADDRRVAV